MFVVYASLPRYPTLPLHHVQAAIRIIFRPGIESLQQGKENNLSWQNKSTRVYIGVVFAPLLALLR